MIVDEQVYLEHFGVKGMHWGIHNQDKTPRTKYKTTGKQKAIIGVGAYATAAVGGRFIMKRMITNGGDPSHALSAVGSAAIPMMVAGGYFTRKLLISHGNVPVKGTPSHLDSEADSILNKGTPK